MRALSNIVDVGWLARHIGDSRVRVLDASWYHRAEGRDARREYAAGHVPGAVFADLDLLAEPEAALPHTLASSDHFARAAGRLGTEDSSHVVVYDASGFRSAPRLWWLFRWAGHDEVSVLDGGLPAWRAAGLPLDTGAYEPPERPFTARGARMPICSAAAVLAAIADGSAQVVDARPYERFVGAAPEPWPGVRSGHIPGSACVPLGRLVDPTSQRLLPARRLHAEFTAAGVRLDRRVIATCGSGVAAAGLVLALQELGTTAVLYDGSWADWGARRELPVAIGTALATSERSER